MASLILELLSVVSIRKITRIWSAILAKQQALQALRRLLPPMDDPKLNRNTFCKFFKHDEVTYVQCGDCDLIFLNENVLSKHRSNLGQ